MNAFDHRAAAARARAFYESLTPADVRRLAEIYAPGAYFRDPFNEVRGVPAIELIFARMFEQLDDCRFTILETIVDAGGAMFTWDMTFRIRRLKSGRVHRIHGATHLRFDPSGRIAYHRDYWDTAEELYAKLPGIGSLVRWLRHWIG